MSCLTGSLPAKQVVVLPNRQFSFQTGQGRNRSRKIGVKIGFKAKLMTEIRTEKVRRRRGGRKGEQIIMLTKKDYKRKKK